MKRFVNFSALSLAVVWGLASHAAADIYQWAYVDPSDPSQGVYQSSTLCPGGAGVSAVPGTNLSYLDLTKAYLISAQVYNANLSYATLANANLSNANLNGGTLTGVNLTGATVSGANLGQTTRYGFTAEQLYSTASYQAGNLGGIAFLADNMTGWNLAGQNLTNASLINATLTNANLNNANLTGAHLEATLTGATFAEATVTGTQFDRTSSFTSQQLYSTASYQTKNLSGIVLSYDSLTGWNFAGQNLTNASLFNGNLTNANLSNANLSHAYLMSGTLTNADLSGAYLAKADMTGATLTNANLSDADLRGATYSSLTGATLHDTILKDGTINGLSLASGETLPVRNYTASSILIHATGTPSFDPTGSVQMIFDGNPWGSTISFDSGVSFSLAGSLNLTVAPGIDESSLVGDTFQLFNWTGTTHTGLFNILADPSCTWDTSQLYTTGNVTLTSVIPEPSALALLSLASLSISAYLFRHRRRD